MGAEVTSTTTGSREVKEGDSVGWEDVGSDRREWDVSSETFDEGLCVGIDGSGKIRGKMGRVRGVESGGIVEKVGTE